MNFDIFIGHSQLFKTVFVLPSRQIITFQKHDNFVLKYSNYCDHFTCMKFEQLVMHQFMGYSLIVAMQYCKGFWGGSHSTSLSLIEQSIVCLCWFTVHFMIWNAIRDVSNNRSTSEYTQTQLCCVIYRSRMVPVQATGKQP